jgi:hypothetical protein
MGDMAWWVGKVSIGQGWTDELAWCERDP